VAWMCPFWLRLGQGAALRATIGPGGGLLAVVASLDVLGTALLFAIGSSVHNGGTFPR
jgi:hypothetical protein